MAIVAAPAVGVRTAPIVRPLQELAVLRTAHSVHPALDRHSTTTGTIRAWRPITGGRTVLPVIGRATKDGVRWLRVMLPGRPNGREGWIEQQGTVLTITSWRVVVSTTKRRVRVYSRGLLTRSFRAVVGKPSTPTPHGRFFVEESVRLVAGSAGAPFALALSARSNVLQEFDGGSGQIAIHGIEHLAGAPGRAVSHGCVRLGETGIRWLAARIGAGVPVTIAR
jgi:lipoprotein-anchoring transpeptidase ErfK/SrfK